MSLKNSTIKTLVVSNSPLVGDNTITAASVIDADGFSERDGHLLLPHQSCSTWLLVSVFLLLPGLQLTHAHKVASLISGVMNVRGHLTREEEQMLARQKRKKNSLGSNLIVQKILSNLKHWKHLFVITGQAKTEQKE